MCDEQPQAGVSPTHLQPSPLCGADVGVLGSSQPCTNTFPAHSCQTRGCAGGPPHISSLLILPPCLSQLLILSALLAPSLFSLCVQNSTKALTAPRAVTQTVKNVYVLVAFHFCVLILHTQARALTHGVPGASAGCRPREPSQSKGIWALLEKAGKEERKIQKQKKDLETSSSSSLCPCSRCGWGQGVLHRWGFARLCLSQQSPHVPCHPPSIPHGTGAGDGSLV